MIERIIGTPPATAASYCKLTLFFSAILASSSPYFAIKALFAVITCFLFFKAEKELAKEIEVEEKMQTKKNKKITRKENKKAKEVVKLEASVDNVKISLNKFSEIVEKINNRNNLRPYPDINDIQK